MNGKDDRDWLLTLLIASFIAYVDSPLPSHIKFGRLHQSRPLDGVSDCDEAMAIQMQQSVELPTEQGNIGAVMDDNLTIVAIPQGCSAEGVLLPGDKIVKINEITVNSRQHLQSLLLSCGTKARFVILRDITSECQHNEAKNETNERNNMQKSATEWIECGYCFKEVTICFNGKTGKKLGLGIKDYYRMVIVSRTDPDSVSSEVLREGDTIVEIEGQKTTNKDEARSLLLDSLKKKGEVKLKVLRAESEEAQKHASDRLMSSRSENSTNQPSVAMKSDVIEIAQRERERILNRGNPNPTRGILTHHMAPSSMRAAIDSNHQSMYIGQDDNDVGKLRKVQSKEDDQFGEIFPLL